METIINNLNFDDNGLLSVIVQDHKTDTILMSAFANIEAVKKTIKTKKAHFYSRSRKKLWMKGEESGHILNVKSISIDCDGDCLIYKAIPTGNVCHTGNFSCFYRKFELSDKKSNITKTNKKNIAKIVLKDKEVNEILNKLKKTINDRKKSKYEGSYTNYLFKKGIDKVLKKLSEECGETIIAFKNKNRDEIINEVTDFMYHLLVAFEITGIDINEIFIEMRKRFN